MDNKVCLLRHQLLTLLNVFLISFVCFPRANINLFNTVQLGKR